MESEAGAEGTSTEAVCATGAGVTGVASSAAVVLLETTAEIGREVGLRVASTRPGIWLISSTSAEELLVATEFGTGLPGVTF